MLQRNAITIIVASLLLLSGCGSGDPFAYVKVTGKITYDDGSLIPADSLTLTFYPQGGVIDPKTHPRPGEATVDPTTGEILDCTSHKYSDGLVRGRHKVTISSLASGHRSPTELIPAEYFDLAKTPLEVDTANLPFVLKVRKPRP